MSRMKRVEVRYQDPAERIKNTDEVCLGYSEMEAIAEAKRCLNCKNAKCIPGCPVGIDIPAFISEIAEGNFSEAYEVLSKYSALPAVCGRVCPQEDQCEKTCILGIKGDSVAIGKLERFAADYGLENNLNFDIRKEANNKKVAIVGSGPAGVTCAGELANLGYDVSVFEALHIPGGVLVYGIPEFRLPIEIVNKEIDKLKEKGVKIYPNTIVGRTVTIDGLLEDGYEAVFVASGAGLPKFLNIEGENLNGVYSANEYLTRANLMGAHNSDSKTPIKIGEKTAVIGGGNVAMDAARLARRLGSDTTVIYRREMEDLPARAEEVENAVEEGINFEFLSNPREILGDKDGRVKALKLDKMELVDVGGNRKSPRPIENSTYIEDFDTVIMALGTSPNTLIADTTHNLEVDEINRIIVKSQKSGETSKEGVYAGGDIVTGAATVILAMGAGKDAAHAIDRYLRGEE